MSIEKQTSIRYFLCGVLLVLCPLFSCETPYTGHLGPKGFNGWIESEENGFVCLWNGFDRLCIKSIEGPQGPPGKDGRTFIAIKEVPIEVLVEKIIEIVVVKTEVVEVPVIVEKVVERLSVIEVPVEAPVEIPGPERIIEVPVEVFVTETIEVIKEVIGTKIVEVPVETIVEVIKEVYIEVTVEVPGPERIVEVLVKPEPVVTEGAVYTVADYDDPPTGFHSHSIEHTHSGAEHTHKFVHPNGEQDDWERAHNGFNGLAHD